MPEHYSFGLVGFPVEHSLSPRIHNAALQELELSGEYRLYPVEQPSGLPEILDEMRQGNIHGLNVTIPYKSDILPLLDDLTPAAQAMIAANTISIRNGQLIGENTDAKGFLSDLEYLGWSQLDQQDRYALVLGAGGSARAVVYALTRNGWRVAIASRRREQAASLMEIFQAPLDGGLGNRKPVMLSAISLDKETISALDPNPILIVNTTPVGMYPHMEASPWPDGLDFYPQAKLYDLVYNPAETVLMKLAQDNGLQVANGIGMLVEQAALSLEIWTGLTVPRPAMRRAVVEYGIGA